MPRELVVFVLSLLLASLAPACGSSPESFFDAGGDGLDPRPDGGRGDAPHDRGGRPDITVGPPVTLTLGTFNVRNFFDEFDDPKHLDTVESPAAVRAKIKALGKALRRLNVDVLALQEVENRPLLDRLIKDELTSLSYVHVRLVEGNDARGVDVALLSRHPIPRSISHANDRFTGVDGDTTRYGFSRDCLEATIRPAVGRELVLLINHLRASDWKDPNAALKRRHAQAKQVRVIADQTLKYRPNANLAVIGDLNDVPGSKTLELIKNGTVALTHLTDSVSADQRYTTTYRKKKQLIDHILASPGLVDDVVAGSVFIDHSSVFSSTSDHAPIRVTITLK